MPPLVWPIAASDHLCIKNEVQRFARALYMYHAPQLNYMFAYTRNDLLEMFRCTEFGVTC